MILRDLVGLKFPDICLTGEEKPRKNLTQETCPDQGWNPGLLRDRRACYYLFHIGGLKVNSKSRGNSLQIWRVAANMLNKQSWWGVGQMANNSSL